MKTITKLWILISIMILLTPLGLIIPEHFGAGAAWGEWGAEELGQLVGYIPQGLEKLASIWTAPMPDYAFKGWEDKPLQGLSFAYIVSAIAGMGLTAGFIFLIGNLLARKD